MSSRNSNKRPQQNLYGIKKSGGWIFNTFCEMHYPLTILKKNKRISWVNSQDNQSDKPKI